MPYPSKTLQKVMATSSKTSISLDDDFFVMEEVPIPDLDELVAFTYKKMMEIMTANTNMIRKLTLKENPIRSMAR